MTNKELKKKLLETISNPDLKLAVADAPLGSMKDGQWKDSQFFQALWDSLKRTEMRVADYNERGITYKDKDLYIYYGKGGIKVEETPKGIRKMLLYLSEKYDRRIVISDGVLYKNDKVSLTTDGLVDNIEIKRDTATMIAGNDKIVAPYAVITILSNSDSIVAKKFIVMPNNEYNVAIKQSGSVKYKYPTMMSTKMVMKRALNQVYSLLGTGIESDDAEIMDQAIDNQNIDTSTDEPAPVITAEQVEWIESSITDKTEKAVKEWLKKKRIEKYEDITIDVFESLQKKLGENYA